MRISLSSLLARFKGEAPEAPATDVMPSPKDTAWANSSVMYGYTQFERYNPDALIRRKGFGIYKKMALDEQIKAVMKFKRDAITSRDYYFEVPEIVEKPEPPKAPEAPTDQPPPKPGEEPRTGQPPAVGNMPPQLDPAVQQAKELQKKQEQYEKELEKYEDKLRTAIMERAVESMNGSFLDGLNAIMSAMYNGFSITSKMFKQFEYDGKTYWGIDRFRAKPFDTFIFNTDEYGELTEFKQDIGGQHTQLNLKDFVHFVLNPDVDEYYGQSELRECYRAWYSKDQAIKFRNLWLERHAGGMVWAEPDPDKNMNPASQEYQDLQSVLTNIKVSTGIIMPSKVKLHMQYPSNNVAYKEAIDDCDLWIARALLVPNLMGITPTGQTGSYSQSDRQLEAFFWTLDADASRLEDTLNEQVFGPLCELNFGDRNALRFRFKPVSNERKMEIAKVWKDLVTAGSVQATDTDESHLRDMLEFPPAGEPIKKPTPMLPAPGFGGPNAPQSSQGDGKEGGAAPADDGAGKDAGGVPGETVIGRNKVSIATAEQLAAARNRALKRVDFSVIKNRTEDSVNNNALSMGRVMGEIVNDVLKTIESNNLVQETKLDQIADLKLPGGLKVKMRRVVQSALKDAWAIGLKHAASEVDKAKGERFSLKVKPSEVAMIGAEFFDLKSFTITGKLTDDALAKIKTLILNGVKNGNTTQEVMDNIVKTFAQDGMIDRETVLDYFGEATIEGYDLETSNPLARMETIVRTNSFEAINEARYAYFTDPALGGFVEALEYSAILDDRTTDICEALDGHVHPSDSDFWTTYTPPNHFNCRSILIPVTVNDVWQESGRDPGVEPQKGFA